MAVRFKVLKIKYDHSCKSWHEVMIADHKVKKANPLLPCGCTLMLLNVPPYCDEESLHDLFSSHGKIENIYLVKEPSSKITIPSENTHTRLLGFKTAYVIFDNAASVKKFLESNVKECILQNYKLPITGIRKWYKQKKHLKHQNDAILQEVNAFMKEYDNLEKEKSKIKPNTVDEDGWVTVTRRGRNKGIKRAAAIESEILEKEARKNERKQLLNFYAFQIRESKMKYIEDLRRKFEEDKKKLQEMKQKRKFKPF